MTYAITLGSLSQSKPLTLTSSVINPLQIVLNQIVPLTSGDTCYVSFIINSISGTGITSCQFPIAITFTPAIGSGGFPASGPSPYGFSAARVA